MAIDITDGSELCAELGNSLRTKAGIELTLNDGIDDDSELVERLRKNALHLESLMAQSLVLDLNNQSATWTAHSLVLDLGMLFAPLMA